MPVPKFRATLSVATLLLGILGGSGSGLWAGKPTVRPTSFPEHITSVITRVVTYRVHGINTGIKTLAVIDTGRWLILKTHSDSVAPTPDSILILGVRQGVRVANGDTASLSLDELFLLRYRWWVLFESLETGRPPVPWVPWDTLGVRNLAGYPCPGVQTEWFGVPIRVWSYQGIPFAIEKQTPQGVEIWEAIQTQEEPPPEILQWLSLVPQREEASKTKEVQP